MEHWRLSNLCFVKQGFQLHVLHCLANFCEIHNRPDNSFLYLLREHLFEHGDDLKKIDNKTIIHLLKDYKAGKIDRKDPDIRNLMKHNKKVTKHIFYQNRINKSMAILTNLNANVQRTVKTIEWPNKKIVG